MGRDDKQAMIGFITEDTELIVRPSTKVAVSQ